MIEISLCADCLYPLDDHCEDCEECTCYCDEEEES
jgi:hypothetical protein